MTSSLKADLGVIRELLGGENGQELWHILTALRGPDSPSERADQSPAVHNRLYAARRERKRRTGEVIRGVTFPGVGAARWRDDIDYVTVPPASHQDHYDRHVVKAAAALGLKVVIDEALGKKVKEKVEMKVEALQAEMGTWKALWDSAPMAAPASSKKSLDLAALKAAMEALYVKKGVTTPSSFSLTSEEPTPPSKNQFLLHLPDGPVWITSFLSPSFEVSKIQAKKEGVDFEQWLEERKAAVRPHLTVNMFRADVQAHTMGKLNLLLKTFDQDHRVLTKSWCNSFGLPPTEVTNDIPNDVSDDIPF